MPGTRPDQKLEFTVACIAKNGDHGAPCVWRVARPSINIGPPTTSIIAQPVVVVVVDIVVVVDVVLVDVVDVVDVEVVDVVVVFVLVVVPVMVPVLVTFVVVLVDVVVPVVVVVEVLEVVVLVVPVVEVEVVVAGSGGGGQVIFSSPPVSLNEKLACATLSWYLNTTVPCSTAGDHWNVKLQLLNVVLLSHGGLTNGFVPVEISATGLSSPAPYTLIARTRIL